MDNITDYDGTHNEAYTTIIYTLLYFLLIAKPEMIIAPNSARLSKLVAVFDNLFIGEQLVLLLQP
ncbi:hypothetical protein J2TS4_50070 [Paenibacillus sp. J2TS4]|nr:hypothetical protein J2TS4_50070 [Paenibacillus sp. J2TS4]